MMVLAVVVAYGAFDEWTQSFVPGRQPDLQDWWADISGGVCGLGVYGLLTRKNAVNMLMAIELIFNSANINLVAFSRFVTGDAEGQVFALFVIVIAACEAAVALAIVMSLYRILKGVNLEDASALRG